MKINNKLVKFLSKFRLASFSFSKYILHIKQHSEAEFIVVDIQYVENKGSIEKELIL